MESSKKVAVIVSVGVAAAAAGIAVVVAIAKWRAQQNADQKLATRLRDVQDVLADFYDKIKKIESHMPDLAEVAIPLAIADALGANGHSNH